MTPDELLSTHRGYVTEVALKYRRYGVPLEDLINEGAIGLLEAAQRFDPSRGTRFLTYASYWIHKQILSALEHQSRIVRVPDYRLKKIRRRMRVENALLHEFGRHPTREEISERMGSHGCADVGEPALHTVEMSIEGSPDDLRPAILSLADLSTRDPENALLHDETAALVRRAIRILSPRQRQVIIGRYGLLDGRRRTLRELSREIGVSREGVRKIEMTARRRIAVFLTTLHSGAAPRVASLGRERRAQPC